MAADAPDRPGVVALLDELEVRRHARRGLAAGILVATLVFLGFAYLPGTDESLVYWAALSAVLASAVAGLVTAVLVARAAYRRTRSVHGLGPSRRSPATLAALVGLVGWVLVPVVATVARPAPGFRLQVAVVTGGFLAVAVGGLGLRLAVALSVTHAWRPGSAAAGAVAYTAVVATPAVWCPSGGPCLGTPDGLVAAVVGLDPGAVAAGYLAVVLVGGFAVGAGLGLRGAAPSHGFAAGAVASVAALPVAAAASGDPAVVRTTALYLPLLLGTLGAAGTAAVVAARPREGSPER